MTAPTNKIVKLETANNPNYDAVQAMPLDTSKLKTLTLENSFESVVEYGIIELHKDTSLIEITVVPTDFALRAPVFVQTHSADPSVKAGVHVPPGTKTYTVAPSDEPRTLHFYVPDFGIPTGRQLMIQVLEAD